jgi:hypothetical protein
MTSLKFIRTELDEVEEGPTRLYRLARHFKQWKHPQSQDAVFAADVEPAAPE